MPSTDPAVRRAHYLRNREKYIAHSKASYQRRKADAYANPSHA